MYSKTDRRKKKNRRERVQMEEGLILIIPLLLIAIIRIVPLGKLETVRNGKGFGYGCIWLRFGLS